MKSDSANFFVSVLLVCMIIGACSRSAAFAGNISDLWGRSGELWCPQSRLPDFSYAGYRFGERAIPYVRSKTNFKEDFGAKGDGVTDDTRALRDAIANTSNGAIYIPPGRYKITDFIEIRKSNVVLRGAGEAETKLYFPRSIREITGMADYFGGLIKIEGRNKGSKKTSVTANANRGDTTLRVASTSGISAGMLVRLRMNNPQDNSLGCRLYGDLGCLNAQRQTWFGRRIVDWVVRVLGVSGNRVTLERPLRIDVNTRWNPEIWSFSPTVQEVGLEDLTIEFPNVQYGGHHKEAGYYGIYFLGVYNSWVRNVTITDADNCVTIRGGGLNTISNVTLKTNWRTDVGDGNESGSGHYGFLMGGLTQDNLITDCDLNARYVHDLNVGAFANGNVYSSITTKGGACDHHGAAPYENLYTDILTDTPGRLFYSGGNRNDEPNAGARTTFWNIRKTGGNFPHKIPTLADGKAKWPFINVIGIDKWSTPKTRGLGGANQEWIERWPGETTTPANLYRAQLAKRLAGDTVRMEAEWYSTKKGTDTWDGEVQVEIRQGPGSD